MKSHLLLLIIIFMGVNTFPQVPQGLNYQAVARDMNGDELTEQALTVRIGVLQDEVLVWQEEHNVTTNSIGLFNLVIGNPDVVGSGTAGTFADISWGTGVFEIKVDINDGSGYTDFNPSPLQSVPFALHAANGPAGPQGPQGDTGPEGPAGPQGDTGPQGIQGVQGPQGPSGPKGDQGIQGQVGPQGEQGPQGIQGEKGDTGTGLMNQGDWISGTTYNPGDYVFDRSTGDPGINSMWILEDQVAYLSNINPFNDPTHWAEFQAPEGPQGPQGDQGPQGPQGLTGPEGPEGPIGQTGLQGPQGLQGEAGPQGPQGEVGPEGPQGIPGDPATDTDDQTLSIVGNNLTISEGNTVPLPPDQVNDADADPLNELQNLSINDHRLTITSGNYVDLPDNVDDADNSVTNEIQDLRYTGGVISLTNDPTPTSVDLPAIIADESVWDMNAETIVTSNVVEISASSPDTITPLFEVKNDLGNPVFAVYNDGVIVYVDEDKKGVKGGFAVGGYSKTSKGLTQEYLRVWPDSTRIYVNDDAMAKGVKGGFAVGGYSKTSKGLTDNYMEITRASTHVFFDTTELSQAKGVKGGFAVGGYTQGKGTPSQLMSLTPANYLIGHEAGTNITTGRNNSFIGFESGMISTTGSNNIFLGFGSGKANLSGSFNFFAGNQSGFLNSSGAHNIMIGFYSGASNTTGQNNIFIGNQSGFLNQDGNYNTYVGFQSGATGGHLTTDPSYNTFLGYQAGYYNRTGEFNTFIGFKSGFSSTSGASGSHNVFIGDSTGYSNISGQYNVFIGAASGKFNTVGVFNTFMGYQAGWSNTTGIENVILGYQAGLKANGDRNVILGNVAGFNSDVSNSVIIGDEAGYNAQTGWGNVIIGQRAGFNNGASGGSPGRNTFVGRNSGENNDAGQANTYLGAYAGNDAINGSFNTFLGDGTCESGIPKNGNTYAGYRAALNNDGENNVVIGREAGSFGQSWTSNANYDQNVILGYRAGYLNQTGDGNVFLGPYAGYSETTSSKLYIDNSSTSAPLIYGNFSSDALTINGSLAVSGAITASNTISSLQNITIGNGTAARNVVINGNTSSNSTLEFREAGNYGGAFGYNPIDNYLFLYQGANALWAKNGRVTIYGGLPGTVYELDVNGQIECTSITQTSDARFKKDIQTISASLDKVLNLSGVYFKWDEEAFPDKEFDSGRHIGLIAQEVEKVLPEVVIYDDDGYGAVDYSKTVAVLIEAIKEQQGQIEALESRINELEK